MNIYITLDYELYLGGRTGTVQNCLITPTNCLLSLLNQYSVKATFFVDASYIYRLRELKGEFPSLNEDYRKICEQVKTIVNNGHSIGLHLHPQWFYSNYDGEKWMMDFDHYKLSDMSISEADKCFEDCCDILREVSGSTVNSFRAGGYSVQGYNNLAKMMRKCGVKNDSTVLFKNKNCSILHNYDYTHVKDSDSYFFTNDITKEDSLGDLCEYPIAAAKVSYVQYCYRRYKYGRIPENRNWGDGGVSAEKRSRHFLRNLMRKTKWSLYVSATLDYQSFFFFDIVYRSLKLRRKKDFVIIGHPKGLSPVSLEMLDKFISETIHEHHFKCF